MQSRVMTGKSAVDDATPRPSSPSLKDPTPSGPTVSHIHGDCKQRSSSVGTAGPDCRYWCKAVTISALSQFATATAAGHREPCEHRGRQCLRQHEGRARGRAIQETRIRVTSRSAQRSTDCSQSVPVVRRGDPAEEPPQGTFGIVRKPMGLRTRFCFPIKATVCAGATVSLEDSDS